MLLAWVGGPVVGLAAHAGERELIVMVVPMFHFFQAKTAEGDFGTRIWMMLDQRAADAPPVAQCKLGGRRRGFQTVNWPQ